MNNNIERDLKRCLGLISTDRQMQNNEFDNKIKFIYNVTSFDECLKLIEANNADKNYALHR